MELLKNIVNFLRRKKFKKWSLHGAAYKKTINIYIKKILNIISGEKILILK